MNNIDNMYDVIIVGGGPAGLSSAIYAARAKYKTLVIEKEKFGGQITITNEVVNYPAVYRTSGSKLTEEMKKQGESFGAEFKIAEVLDIDMKADIKTIKTSIGEYRALSIILATGAAPRSLGFKGEEEFKGRGVAYCATCDGEFFTNMPVYVIGGGFAAVEESIFLTKYASSVKVIVRGKEFRCAKSASDKLFKEDKITVSFNTEVISVSGEGSLDTIKLKNNETNEEWEEYHKDGFGVFVFAGYVPNTSWLKERIETKDGYILTDANKKTNVDGIYAAGDVCMKNLRQVVTSAADGAIAATSSEKYLKEMHTKLDLPEFEIEVTSRLKENNDDKDENTSDFLSEDIKIGLKDIFSKFQNRVIIKAILDESSLGKEVEGFLKEFCSLTDMVSYEIEKSRDEDKIVPYMELLFENGVTSGIRFSLMPGGHEFNSFVVALYNVAGPGTEISPEDKVRIEKLKGRYDIKVLVSLSCTKCPDVVMGTQKIASLSSNVVATAIDIYHFKEIKDKYKVMSVPCFIINDEEVHFGKKSLTEILDILENKNR